MTNENEAVTSQMSMFTDALNEGLTAGEKYVKLIDQLIKTNEAEPLLDAANQLSLYKLGNQYVKFPFQYKPEDYYLVFTSRLLDFHNNESLQVSISEDNSNVTAKLKELGNAAEFKFELDRRNHGGAVFTEIRTSQALLYLNLQKRMIRFNNRALINLFVEKLTEVSTNLQIQQAISPLIELANFLKTDLGFSVDLGILDSHNDAQYYLIKKEMSLEIIDKLFVSTEGTDFMLMNLTTQTGMSLQMDSQTKIILASGHGAWYFEVQDADENVSFFDVLIKYKLIKQWFINNRDNLEIKSDPAIFSE